MIGEIPPDVANHEKTKRNAKENQRGNIDWGKGAVLQLR
jgi:hypothetical protein